MWKCNLAPWALGGILWCVWLAKPVEPLLADPAFDTPVFRATETLERHVVLSRYIGEEALGAHSFLRQDVQRRLANAKHAFALALEGADQACALVLSDAAAARFVAGKDLVDELARQVIEPLRPHVAALAQDDCVIEISLVDTETGPMVYALADFITQSPVDARPEGVLTVTVENKTASYRVLYMRHAVARDFPTRRWHEGLLTELVKVLAPGDILVALDEKGFVVGGESGPFEVTYFDAQGQPPRSFRVCSSTELSARYPNPRGALRRLQGLSDIKIAARSLPGLWHEPSYLEVAAYALCS